MIERYSPKQISKIWTEEEKFQRFLAIEILVCEALAKAGKIPLNSLHRIKKNAKISVKRIKKFEVSTHHDIIAFLKDLSFSIGSDARYLHIGLTSSDLLDTTLAWRIKDATKIILKDLNTLIKEVKKKALKYKDTLCVARTHGVHAEPYSFGLKFAYFYQELTQQEKMLSESIDFVAQGKISGAVGTFAHINPKVEEYVCKKIGIKNTAVSTQIVSRERFAYYLSLLALMGAVLERFATEIRHLHRSEVQEAQEPFYKGQKGSSAMPHKKNPIICERICGLSRLLRGNLTAALENINLWHERDISHSSAERVIIPDSTIIADYMLQKMAEVVRNLAVYPENMLKNMELNRGIIYSQKLLLKLMEKGQRRLQAYDIVQNISLRVINNKSQFEEEALKDKTLRKYLTQKEIEDSFNPYAYLANVDKIYKRAGIV